MKEHAEQELENYTAVLIVQMQQVTISHVISFSL